MCGVAVLDRYVSATEWRENLSGAGVWEHWNLPSLHLKYCAMLGNLEVRKVTGRTRTATPGSVQVVLDSKCTLLLLMLEAAQRGPRFTISLKAQHPNSSAINKLPADYPIFGPKGDKLGRGRLGR